MKTDKPNIIYLQDEDVNDNYEGVTWCFHKIDDNDSKYIKADYLKDMIDEIISALERRGLKGDQVGIALTELRSKL